jgi:hypothetical protein
MVIGPNFHYN